MRWKTKPILSYDKNKLRIPGKTVKKIIYEFDFGIPLKTILYINNKASKGKFYLKYEIS